MDYYDIVKKLIGPIESVGETNADIQRALNLGEAMKLVDKLIFDISWAAKSKDSPEASRKQIGYKAHRFLEELAEHLGYDYARQPQAPGSDEG